MRISERKGYTVRDVMDAGGWKSEEMLLRSYQHADAETIKERSVASDAPDRERVETHSITHSMGRREEKAPQQKSPQTLLFTQSGRRDLNPRPPEPHLFVVR